MIMMTLYARQQKRHRCKLLGTWTGTVSTQADLALNSFFQKTILGKTERLVAKTQCPWDITGTYM